MECGPLFEWQDSNNFISLFVYWFLAYNIVVVQLLSLVWLFVNPRTAAGQASLFFTISRNLIKLMSIEYMMASKHLILCHPFLLQPSFFPSIRIYSNESALCIRWSSTGASVSASILPMNIQDWFPLGLPGLISLLSKRQFITFMMLFSSVQSLSRVRLCNQIDCSTTVFPAHHQITEATQTHVHCIGDAIQPAHPLTAPTPTFNLSSIRVFSNESFLHIRWPEYWSLSYSISPSN